MSKLDEQVLVVPASVIDNIGGFTGYCENADRYLPAILAKSNQQFVARSICETDPSLKQLIPYLIVEAVDSNSPRIFRYTRGSGQTEARLHAKQSIGIGGHISIDDCSGDDLYTTGMLRELNEELILGEVLSNKIVGLVYDPSNDVGTVHLGIVHRIQVREHEVQTREDELEFAGFVDIANILADFSRLETWSQLCVQALYK